MAKEKTAVQLDENNIIDTIKQGNILKETAISGALAEIEKKTDEKQKQQAMDAICSAKYNTAKTLLQLRARRREEKATKEALSKNSDLLAKLIGQTHDGKPVDAKDRITPLQYETEKDKVRDELRKACNESDKQLNEEIRELQNSFEGAYKYYWD